MTQNSQLSPLLVQLVETMQAAALVTGTDLERPGPTIVYANRAFCEQSGYTLEELVGQSPRILQGPRTHDETLRRLRSSLEKREDFAGETWNYRKDGTEYRVRWYIQHLYDEDGEVSNLFAIQEDVTERVALVRDLMGLARASFEGLSVAGFAQLLAMEEKTCRVRVRHWGAEASLVFDGGRLVDASVDGRSGEDAALTILGWSRAQMDLEPLADKPVATLDRPLEYLILESARRQDEAAHAEPTTGDGDPAAAPDPAAEVGSVEALGSVVSTEKSREAFAVVRRTGARGVALVEAKHGTVLASVSDVESLDLDRLAVANSHFVRYKTRLLSVLGVDDDLEDIVVTHQRDWHLLRPIRGTASMYLFAVVAKTGGTLPLARQSLADAEGILLRR